MISTAQSALERSARALAKQDLQIKQLLRDFGMPSSRRRPPGFSTLVSIVMGQQISTQAAAAIWKRLKQTVGTVNAATITTTPETDLRSAGLSVSKVKTLKVLAENVSRGAINFRRFNRLSDEEIKSGLTSIWGIGDWTAEIYLMFGMGRPDVWPTGDLALRTGWQALTQSSSRIEAIELAEIAERWQPHRTTAAILLWHVVAATRQKN